MTERMSQEEYFKMFPERRQQPQPARIDQSEYIKEEKKAERQAQHGRGDKAKATFLDQLASADIVQPDKEFYFARPNRMWRWDYAWTGLKLAIEYQGGIFRNKGEGSKTGHNSPEGMLKDMEKYNAGTVRGWAILLINANSVNSKAAISAVVSWFDRIMTPERRRQLFNALNNERVRLNFDLPTTPEQVALVDEMENDEPDALYPNASKPTLMLLPGRHGAGPGGVDEHAVVALHLFSDKDLWLCALNETNNRWEMVRRATIQDQHSVPRLTKRDLDLKVR